MARSFNGSTDEINLTNNGNISSITGTAARSIVSWVNPTALGGTSFSYGVESQDTRCSLTMGGTGTIVIGFNQDTMTTNGTPLSTASWQHIGFSFAGGTNNTTNTLIYYNGANQASTQSGVGNTPNTTNSNFGIGFNRPGPSSFFNGSIADVACWNVVLTAAEFLALARGARPYTIRSAALVGWWPLDGIQSTEPDLSGLANNGTLTGTALAPGPPVMLFTPLIPSLLPMAATSTVFRKTLSQIGGRVGTRQQIGWGM